MAILPSLDPTTYKGLDEYLKTRKELGQTDKRSPFFKNLPDVVINIPKKKETSPMQGVPKQRRVLGIPEPLLFGLLGVVALGSVIYLSMRKKIK
jgi:hypothetical protein